MLGTFHFPIIGFTLAHLISLRLESYVTKNDAQNYLAMQSYTCGELSALQGLLLRFKSYLT